MLLITRPCGLDGITTPLGTSYLKTHGTLVKAERLKSVNLKALHITIIRSSQYLTEIS